MFFKNKFKFLLFICIFFIKNTESKIPIGVVYSLIAFYTGFNIKNIYKFSKDILPLLVLYSGYEINNIIREKSFKNLIFKSSLEIIKEQGFKFLNEKVKEFFKENFE